MFSLRTNQDDEWQSQGNCYQRREEVQELNSLLGYDMFYPETGKGPEAMKYSDKFCKGCPVLVRCYYEGLHERGTWGGASETERRRQALRQNTTLSTLLGRLAGQSQDENKPPSEESNPDPSPS